MHCVTGYFVIIGSLYAQLQAKASQVMHATFPLSSLHT